MKKIITTVGTSLITNALNDGADIGDTYEKFKGKPYIDLVINKPRVEKLRAELQKIIQQNDFSISAEIASLIKIAKELNEPLDIYLIATDTILSAICAEMIKKWFENAKAQMGVEGIEFFENIYFDANTKFIIPGLQVKNRNQFEREGMTRLVERLNDLTNNYDTIYNITGGYKAIIPYMTIIGQIYQIPVYYTFKGDDSQDEFELIRIPQAPFDINWNMFEKYKKVIDDLEIGIERWEIYKMKNKIDDDFSLCVYHDPVDDTAFLSGIGQLFYDKFNQWLMIKVLANGPFSEKQADRNRKILNQAIEGLHNMLNDFINNNKSNWGDIDRDTIYQAIKTNGTDLLNHANKGNQNYFICKYPSANPEIRLLYTFDYKNETLTELAIYNFKIGGFNHGDYVDEFHSFYKNNKEKDLIPYLQTMTKG